MFFGKIEELICCLKCVKIVNQWVEIFKFKVDICYDEAKVVFYDVNYIFFMFIEYFCCLLELMEGVNVIGVDEVQFFDEDLLEVCQMLALCGLWVIVVGLDMDF